MAAVVPYDHKFQPHVAHAPGVSFTKVREHLVAIVTDCSRILVKLALYLTPACRMMAHPRVRAEV